MLCLQQHGIYCQVNRPTCYRFREIAIKSLFIDAGHRDGVHCCVRHPKRLSVILSGACDGELRIWNLATKKCLYAKTLHE